MDAAEFQTLAAANISADPQYRLHQTMKDAIEKLKDKSANEYIIDVHGHCFTLKHVPKKFVGPSFLQYPGVVWTLEKILRFASFLTMIIRGRGSNYYKAFARRRFITVFTNEKEQTDVLQLHWGNFNYYFTKLAKKEKAPHLMICELMMDMERGIGGGTDESFYQQVEGMDRMRNHSRNAAMIVPFFACDPRNPTLFEDFLAAFTDTDKRVNRTDHQYFDTMSPFFGVKIYPTLGYLPSHPKLMQIFKVCAEKNIPVTTHCGGASTKFEGHKVQGDYFQWDENARQLIPMHFDLNFRDYRRSQRDIQVVKFFNSPKNWIPVMETYPKLKVNLAHMGSSDEWYDYRRGVADTHVHESLYMVEKYANIYLDISYSFSNNANLKKMYEIMTTNNYSTAATTAYRNKIMYGTDFYMTQNEKHLATLVKNLFAQFKDNTEALNRLCIHNPLAFLTNKTNN